MPKRRRVRWRREALRALSILDTALHDKNHNDLDWKAIAVETWFWLEVARKDEALTRPAKYKNGAKKKLDTIQLS